MVESQQAQVQKDKHDSVSSWGRDGQFGRKYKVSFPLSNTLQSSVSPQGRHERMRMYKDNMIEKNFI